MAAESNGGVPGEADAVAGDRNPGLTQWCAELVELWPELPARDQLRRQGEAACGAPLSDRALKTILDVVEEACTNIRFKKATEKIKIGVLQGEGFSSNVSRSDLFSPTIKQMIATGERSGSLDLVASKMADYLDELAQGQLRKLSALFEPLVIIVMGIIVGFIVISLMLPLFRLSSAIGGGG